MRDDTDDRLARLQFLAATLRQRMALTAASIADTEDWLAEILDRAARIRPHAAHRLTVMALRARQYAAYERRQAASHAMGVLGPDTSPAGPDIPR
jgi:hypothetical protein